MTRFAKRHWSGDYPLVRSLLVNTLIPDALLLAIQGRLETTALFLDLTAGRYFFVVMVLLWSTLLVWQFTGCFRSASSRVGFSGSTLGLYVTLFSLLITFLPVLGGILRLGDQYNRAVQQYELPSGPSATPFNTDPYEITLLSNEVLAFTGEIDFGATRKLLSVLSKHPDIKQLNLDSEGGIVVEARGMANNISLKGLNTHVDADCFSACTLVYISGQSRSLGNDARLGFHQYLLNSRYFPHWVDPNLEQDKDQQRFANQNVAPSFLNQMYASDHESLWIPTHAELAEAGVTTRGK